MNISFAEKSDKIAVIDFFGKHISEENDGLTTGEFLCPFGISAAISREQVIAIKDSGMIVGGLRFYPRKRDNAVSVYQFALDDRFRSNGLIAKMLEFTGYCSFMYACPVKSSLNNYFHKSGWEHIRSDNRYDYWNLRLKRT